MAEMADPGGEDDEGEGVDEGGEDAGALVAEGLLVGGGAASGSRRRRRRAGWPA